MPQQFNQRASPGFTTPMADVIPVQGEDHVLCVRHAHPFMQRHENRSYLGISPVCVLFEAPNIDKNSWIYVTLRSIQHHNSICYLKVKFLMNFGCIPFNGDIIAAKWRVRKY